MSSTTTPTAGVYTLTQFLEACDFETRAELSSMWQMRKTLTVIGPAAHTLSVSRNEGTSLSAKWQANLHYTKCCYYGFGDTPAVAVKSAIDIFAKHYEEDQLSTIDAMTKGLSSTTL